MKKLFITSLMAVFFSSCLTVGMIERNCEEFAKVCNTTTTVYKDTTIFLKDTIRIILPNDTVTIEKYLSVNNGIVSLKPVSVSKGLISAKAWVSNSQLNVDAWLNKSYVEKVRVDTIKIEKIVTKTANTVYIKEPYIPKFYKYCTWTFILIITISALFLFLKNKFGSVSSILSAVKNLF